MQITERDGESVIDGPDIVLLVIGGQNDADRGCTANVALSVVDHCLGPLGDTSLLISPSIRKIPIDGSP